MKKLLLTITALLALPSVLADGWDMMGSYGMMGTGMMGWGLGSLFGLVYIAIISFVFSVIFWWTYKWIVKGKKK